MSSFNEWGLSNNIIQAIAKMGFEEATPIQEQTIPITLMGRDIIGQAQTGTGKTVAYGIPLVEKVLLDNEKVQGIVVTPTRELAIQVAEELNRIGEFKGVRSLPIYGGQEIIHQIKALKHRPRIIVGTPGRLLDHLRRKTIRLQDIKLVILDEADEMLNMGFIDDIKSILSTVPAERQTLLFSATMPKAIRNLAEQFMINPESISIKRQDVTVPDTEQYYMEVPEREKYEVLCRLLDIQSPNLAIIFGRTKKRVDELSEALIARGYSAEGIHGDLTQSKRDSVIRHFREGTTEILVATDVAARGLDISGVTHVYNFDIPQGAESYVHRVGRTGRAGKTGLAITFITPREHGHLAVIEQVIKRKIVRQPMPTVIEAIEGKQRITVEKLLGALGENGNKHYQRVAQDLLADNDAVTLLSAALRLLTKEPDRTPVKITEHAPLRTKKVHEDRKPWPPRRSKTEKDFARPQVKRKTDRDH